MINLNKDNLSSLKRIIGCSMSHFSADEIDFDSRDNLIFRKITVKLNFKNSELINILFSCDFKFGFYETSDSAVYYDYSINENNLNLNHDKNIYEIDYGLIEKIEIYGKTIPKKHVGELEKMDNKIFQSNITSDELFLFKTIDKLEFLLVFDNFFPRIIIYLHPNEINRFWEINKGTYSLNHSII